MAVGDAERAAMIWEYFSPKQIEAQWKKAREKKRSAQPRFEQLALPWPEIEMISRVEFLRRLK